jgi:hypothetical protein
LLCAGYANSPLPLLKAWSTAAVDARRSGGSTGRYVVRARPVRANSRIPLIELWLSEVSTNRVPRRNGYASPTSRAAAVALAVKTTAYSSGSASRCRSTARRALSTNSVEAVDVGLTEWGLPNTPPRSRS